MIVKVNKKGGDCGCNKKLAKGGCAPKKKKIKKNRNGGLLAISEIPIYQGGTSKEGVYRLEGNNLLNQNNKPRDYNKKWKNRKDGYYEYTETADLYPQIDEHDNYLENPQLIRTIRYPKDFSQVPDTTAILLTNGKKGVEIVVPKATADNKGRTPQWKFINNLIDLAKTNKKEK